VVVELHAAGLLTGVDRAALAAYCVTWARWVKAEEHLQSDKYTFTTEKGYEGQSPWIGIANSALTLMHKYMVEFGMTPSSRSRVKVEKPPEADPFSEYLNSRGGVNLD
jgi:P27 family predicted phage terminase small subunit